MLPTLRNGPARTSNAPANRLASVFDHFFDDRPFAALTAVPLVVWEDEDKVSVEVDLPGVCESDVELTVHEGVLTIRAERKRRGPETMYDSRNYGRFEQRIALPSGVESDRVEASLKDGVLAITLPKTPAAKPRKIELGAAKA